MRYSKFQGVVRWSGGTILLKNGQSIDDNHQLVRERPDLFTDKEGGPDIKDEGPATPNVERATAAPGEMRVTPGTGPARNRVQKTGGSDQ